MTAVQIGSGGTISPAPLPWIPLASWRGLPGGASVGEPPPQHLLHQLAGRLVALPSLWPALKTPRQIWLRLHDRASPLPWIPPSWAIV
jgi:hypothetical protein